MKLIFYHFSFKTSLDTSYESSIRANNMVLCLLYFLLEIVQNL